MDKVTWYNNCQLYGYDYALKTLTMYIINGKPNDFLPDCGTRTMSKIASLAIEGMHIDTNIDYLDTLYGFDLYMKMFGNYDYNKESDEIT